MTTVELAVAGGEVEVTVEEGAAAAIEEVFVGEEIVAREVALVMEGVI